MSGELTLDWQQFPIEKRRSHRTCALLQEAPAHTYSSVQRMQQESQGTSERRTGSCHAPEPHVRTVSRLTAFDSQLCCSHVGTARVAVVPGRGPSINCTPPSRMYNFAKVGL